MPPWDENQFFFVSRELDVTFHFSGWSLLRAGGATAESPQLGVIWDVATPAPWKSTAVLPLDF